jgi:hypothetical protein
MRSNLVLLASVLALSGCVGWIARYQEVGRMSQASAPVVLVQPSEVEIYVQEIPKGFVVSNGSLAPAEGTKNRVLGKISVEPEKRLQYSTAIKSITREEKITLLKKKASEVGANAVVNAYIPSDAKDDLYASAGGIAVIIAKQ